MKIQSIPLRTQRVWIQTFGQGRNQAHTISVKRLPQSFGFFFSKLQATANRSFKQVFLLQPQQPSNIKHAEHNSSKNTFSSASLFHSPPSTSSIVKWRLWHSTTEMSKSTATFCTTIKSRISSNSKTSSFPGFIWLHYIYPKVSRFVFLISIQ